MKIAFFCCLPLEYGGGTARFFIDAAVGLKKRYPHLNIFLISLNENLTNKITALYSFYFRRNVRNELEKSSLDLADKLASYNLKYLKVGDFPTLNKILSEFKTVYSKNDILEAFILRFFAGQSIKKLIFGFHTPIHYEKPLKVQDYLHNFLYNSFLYKNLVSRADKFHVLNQYDKLLLGKHFKGKKIRKIYNPFIFADFERIEFRKKEKLSKNNRKLNILWVGRLTVEKGADDLIKLIGEINKTAVGKSIVWNIVGAGDLGTEIEFLSEKFHNINYLGYQKREELDNTYNSADIFISTSKWESFPYTFVEAQCFGLPIISYDIHGCNEIVEDEVTGYLAKSFVELKEKVIYLVKNKNKLIKKNRVKKQFRELVNNKKIFSALYELLQ